MSRTVTPAHVPAAGQSRIVVSRVHAPLRGSPIQGAVRHLARAKNAPIAIVQDSGARLKVVHLPSLRLLGTLKTGSPRPLGMGISDDGDEAFALYQPGGTMDHVVEVYDLLSYRTRHTIRIADKTVHTVQYTPKRFTLMIWAGNSEVSLFSTTSGRMVKIHDGEETRFTKVVPDAQGEGFLAAVESDPVHGTLKKVQWVGFAEGHVEMWRPRGPWVHYSLHENALYYNDNKQLVRLNSHFRIQGAAWHTLQTNRGSLLGERSGKALFYRYYNTLKLYAFDTGEELFSWRFPARRPYKMGFTGDGRYGWVASPSGVTGESYIIATSGAMRAYVKSDRPWDLQVLHEKGRFLFLDTKRGTVWRLRKEELTKPQRLSSRGNGVGKEVCPGTTRGASVAQGPRVRRRPPLSFRRRLYVPRARTQFHFSPRGTYLITMENGLIGVPQPRVTLWDSTGWRRKWRHRLFIDSVEQVMMDPLESSVVATGWDTSFWEPQSLRIGRWELRSGRKRAASSLPVRVDDAVKHSNSLLHVGSRTVLYATPELTLHRLDRKTLKHAHAPERRLPSRGEFARGGARSDLVVSVAPNHHDGPGTRHYLLTVYDAKSARALRSWKVGALLRWGLSGCGELVWVLHESPGGGAADLDVYQLATGHSVRSHPRLLPLPVSSARYALSCRGEMFALAHRGLGLRLISLLDGERYALDGSLDPAKFGALRYSPDTRHLAVRWGRWIRIYAGNQAYDPVSTPPAAGAKP